MSKEDITILNNYYDLINPPLMDYQKSFINKINKNTQVLYTAPKQPGDTFLRWLFLSSFLPFYKITFSDCIYLNKMLKGIRNLDSYEMYQTYSELHFKYRHISIVKELKNNRDKD